MSSAANKKFSRKRLIFLIGGISLFWLILEINLFRIQIVNNERYAKMAANQYLKKIPLPARRGLVLDCNGNQLISNTLHYDLAADPKLIKNKKRLAGICAARFNRSREYFLNRLKQKSRFVYLRRKVPYATIQPILKLNDAGIITPENFRREYPYGPYAAQLLGFTDPDDKGLSGLELQFDDILRGKDGNAVLQYDGPRRVFFNADNPIKRPDNGLNIQLTIDKNIQTVVDQELAEGVKNMRAKSGMAVVVDPYSGRVLAMANYPSFDPNRQQNYGQEVKRNRVITDVYEPGSTMKIITAAILLQERLKKRDDLVFCENGSFRLYNRIFSDTKKHGWLTLQGAVEKSSNIGIIKLSAAIDKNTMFRFLKNFGFGSKTGIGLIGEAEGSLLPPQKWNKITKASLSFGYGISVTTLQMAMAYASAVNGGYLYQPYIIDHFENEAGEISNQARPQIVRQIISKEISEQLKAFMRGVVTKGTGKKAAVAGIKVGGKTGTARKLKKDRSGYHSKKYIASFVGFAPYEKPEFVCAIVMDEPKKSFYGGGAAAPVFSKIIKRIINLGSNAERYRYTESQSKKALIKKITDLPALDGFNIASAEELLKARDIAYETEGRGRVVKSHSIDDGTVILHSGSLQVKNGAVPKLTGLTLREALAKVDMSKFRIELRGKNRGMVYKQEPQPGKRIKTRTTLTLTCR